MYCTANCPLDCRKKISRKPYKDYDKVSRADFSPKCKKFITMIVQTITLEEEVTV